MSPRVYTRKFDWEEARRLHAGGLSYQKIADRFGVSATAVMFACDDRARERMHAYVSEWQRQGVCVDCGGQCSRKFARCVACASALRATTVGDGVLRCVNCREWKPDDEFPMGQNRTALRRGRHNNCRACQTVLRRAYRDRNKVPCANGCGTMVLAPNEQAASARKKGSVATGMCRKCARNRRGR
jgi:hypothetical protein